MSYAQSSTYNAYGQQFSQPNYGSDPRSAQYPSAIDSRHLESSGYTGYAGSHSTSQQQQPNLQRQYGSETPYAASYGSYPGSASRASRSQAHQTPMQQFQNTALRQAPYDGVGSYAVQTTASQPKAYTMSTGQQSTYGGSSRCEHRKFYRGDETGSWVVCKGCGESFTAPRNK